jgi:hypothetical protein
VNVVAGRRPIPREDAGISARDAEPDDEGNVMKAVADLSSTRDDMNDCKTDQVDPLPPRLYGRRDLAELFGVTTETIRAWEQRDILPPPLKLGGRAMWDPRVIAALLAETHA